MQPHQQSDEPPREIDEHAALQMREIEAATPYCAHHARYTAMTTLLAVIVVEGVAREVNEAAPSKTSQGL